MSFPCIINKLSIVIDLTKKQSYVSHCLYVQPLAFREGLYVQLLTSSKRLDSILIPGNDEVSSKAKEAKNVETLMKNMDEALAKNMDEPLVQRGVCCKIIASEVNEPLLLDIIVGLVDDIFDWYDLASFVAKRNKKKKQRQVQLLHGK
ncbi:hypothetical protein SLE2022_212390 [Rubroshorea leprosula]